MCGFVNYVRRYLEGKSLSEPKHEKVPTEDDIESPQKIVKLAGSEDKKKAALEFLDEEIEKLKQTKKVVKPKSKLESMEAKLFSSLTTNIITSAAKAPAKETTNTGWDDDNESGDLDFNDLEISFDKK